MRCSVELVDNVVRVGLPDGGMAMMSPEEAHDLLARLVDGLGLAEVSAGAEDALGKAIGAALWGMVKALRDRGRSVPHALSLSAYMAIDGGLGRGAVQSLGITDRAERRMRAVIRECFEGQDLPDEVPAEYFAALLQHMAPLGAAGRPLDGS